MFQMTTWVSYSKSFGATAANIEDPVLQHEVTRNMLDQGLGRNWLTCYNKTTKKYGAYPIGVRDP